MLPALVSVFDSEVTSLGPYAHPLLDQSASFNATIQWSERTFARSVWVCAAFRLAILSSHWRDFPLRMQKLGVTLPHGRSRFGAVSSKSHWQALSYVFDCAFHG